MGCWRLPKEPVGIRFLTGAAIVERASSEWNGAVHLPYALDGKVGYIIGAFSNRPGAPDNGKFTLTLKKEDSGRWLIMSDMDNGNRRPQPPATH